MVLYGFVGAQMTWRLSPLIGDPEMEFFLIRPSRDNFFVDVFSASQRALGIGGRGIDMFIAICFGTGVVLVAMLVLFVIPKRNTKVETNSTQTNI